MKNKDLFGNDIKKDPLLRDKFIEPPFSILNSRSGNWRKRVNRWKRLGIKSEVGRKNKNKYNGFDRIASFAKKINGNDNGMLKNSVSIFDPALAELLYYWFVPKGGEILDPFAGGSVRGVVANYLKYKYTGIDIRQEQIESNREQALDILDVNNQPQWYVGDSVQIIDGLNKKFDFVFSCPPYANLEVYSDLKGDISNMDYVNFLKYYEKIITKSCNLLKSGAFACFVVGEVRDKKGNYIGFVPDTIRLFEKCKMKFYNEAIYLQSLAGACLTAGNAMNKSQKLKKVHQNVLVFKKT